MTGYDATRLGIGIVGCGKVGAVIGNALRAAGHAIVGVTATSQASLDRAGAMLPEAPILPIPEVVERSELVMFTVSDDALTDLVAGLAATGTFHEGQIVAHWAGRFGTEVLRPAAAAGAIPIAFHPSMAFTGTSVDVSRLRDAVVAITAAKPVLPIGQALALELGAEPVIIAEADRPAYHAAVSHASNHTVTVVAQAMEILAGLGVEDPSAVLGALVRSSVSNVLDRGQQALTGPVSRGDAGTVAAHLAALHEFAEASGSTELRDTYRAVSRATAERALRYDMITPEQGEALIRILARQPGEGNLE